MNLDNLNKAIHEAERFLERAKTARDSHKPSYYNPNIKVFGGVEAGACKRASMDLTRALSSLRQGKR